MKIRRYNYVTAMDFYAATLSKKYLKKNVTTFICFVVTLIKENEVQFCQDIKNVSRHKEVKWEERISRHNKTMSQ